MMRARRETRGAGGRALGERHGRHVLTDEQVREARDVHMAWHPERGCRALARRYGVSYTAMRRILAYETRWTA